MSKNDIIISIASFNSDNQYDIISSNNQYITKLFQNNIEEDKISEDALKSYYIDYYLSHILHGGFLEFIKNFYNKPKILYYIHSGLETFKAKKHLKLFKKVFYNEDLYKEPYNYDNDFKKIQETESLLYFNHRWLMNHPNLIIINRKSIEERLQEHIDEYKEDKRHVKIVKELCKKIDEDFIAITAGDINNIYNRSWYFKTTQGRYYSIEKNNIVTMYDSFTKKEITQMRLISHNTEPSIISNFFSKIIA